MSVLKKVVQKVKNLGIKDLTPKESIAMFKNLMKTNKTSIQDKLKPGTLLTFVYNAKYDKENFDRTPFVMVLSTTSKYMLGCNFHWAPLFKREIIVQYILEKNKNRIRKKLKIKMTYKELRALLKTVGMFPVVRLYIRKRMSSKGVIVPDDMLMSAVKMKTETFTKGKVNSTTLWQRAKNKINKFRR